MKRTKSIPTNSMMELLAEATDLQFDGGDGENRLHYDTERISVFASLMSEKQYDAMEKLINNKTIKREGYEVGAWNDVSGYKYWSRDEDESNYIQITVYIHDLNKIDIDQLKKDVEKLHNFFVRFDNAEQYFANKGA